VLSARGELMMSERPMVRSAAEAEKKIRAKHVIASAFVA
jgi:hypothetical protein